MIKVKSNLNFEISYFRSRTSTDVNLPQRWEFEMEVACHFRVSLSQLSFDNICNYACCRMKNSRFAPKPTPKPSPFSTEKKYQILEAPARLNSRLKRKRKSIPRPAVLKIGTSKKGFYVHLELLRTYYDWLLGKAICDSYRNFGLIFKHIAWIWIWMTKRPCITSDGDFSSYLIGRNWYNHFRSFSMGGNENMYYPLLST